LERSYDPSGYGELDCTLCQDEVDNDCDIYIDLEEWDCLDCTSPVVIDTLGNGIDLTDPEEGVEFDISGAGRRMRFSWIQADDAFLALDRNGNGIVDSGKELFGAVTAQSNAPGRNGFRALSVYDTPGNGGNGDGLIDSHDAIYTSLRLWLDANHNGFSEQIELSPLHSFNIASLELDYRESSRVDEEGNTFRYRAKVNGATDSNVGRWAWDVFLAHQQGAITHSPHHFSIPRLFVLELPVFAFRRPACGKLK
jgi:hypothetical protein